jgi:hypothetical protein
LLLALCFSFNDRFNDWLDHRLGLYYRLNDWLGFWLNDWRNAA